MELWPVTKCIHGNRVNRSDPKGKKTEVFLRCGFLGQRRTRVDLQKEMGMEDELLSWP